MLEVRGPKVGNLKLLNIQLNIILLLKFKMINLSRSAGVTFFILITLDMPFKPQDDEDVRHAILNDPVPLDNLPKSPSLYKLIINKYLN